MDNTSYCPTCDFDFPEKYQCEKCNFQSNFKVLLTKHFDTVHRSKESHYPTPELRYCENCNFQTYSSLVLLNHTNYCDKNGTASFENIKLKSEYDVQQETAQNVVARLRAKIKKSLEHEEEKTLSSIPNQKETDPFPWLRCGQCRYKTRKEHNLEVHILHEHPTFEKNNWLECEHCSYKTERKSILHRHVLAHHMATVGPEMVKSVKCDQCLYKTTRNTYLREHVLRKHTPPERINWLRCERCSYKTIRNGDLKAHHYKMHTPMDQINWFKCEHCSYKAKKKFTLRRHVNIHKLKTHIHT